MTEFDISCLSKERPHEIKTLNDIVQVTVSISTIGAPKMDRGGLLRHVPSDVIRTMPSCNELATFLFELAEAVEEDRLFAHMQELAYTPAFEAGGWDPDAPRPDTGHPLPHAALIANGDDEPTVDKKKPHRRKAHKAKAPKRTTKKTKVGDVEKAA